jgi:hypothetical protein
MKLKRKLTKKQKREIAFVAGIVYMQKKGPSKSPFPYGSEMYKYWMKGVDTVAFLSDIIDIEVKT